MQIDANFQSAPPPPPFEENALFTGRDGDFRRLVTKGALLELVTAGFYRFWLATNMRRHLWSSTVFGGDALEYLGTGRELLFGFFFALAIFAPIYLIYFLVGLEAERLRTFASLPLGLFFVAFSQFAIYRARRYRLHRTAWRGLRFGMVGSGWAYSWRAMLWGLGVILSLGLALPWAEAALERYKMNNSFYGELQGSFAGRGGALFKRGAWIWLLVIVSILSIGALSENSGKEPSDAHALMLGVLVIGMEIAAVFLYGAYKSIQWKWWLEGVRIGEIRATSRLTLGALIGNYWKYIGVTFLLMLVMGVLAGVGIFFMNRMGVNLHVVPGASPPAGFIVAIAGFYLFALLVMGVVWRIYFIQRVWKLIVGSLSLHGLDSAREVRAREGTANALGEGLIDSLDIIGF